MWKNKNVLVTGGVGFLGFNFAVHLAKLNADISATFFNKYDKHFDPIKFISIDLTKAEDCLKVTQNQDIVFHFFAGFEI